MSEKLFINTTLFIGRFKRFRRPFLFEHAATLFFDFDVKKTVSSLGKNKDLHGSATFPDGILFIWKKYVIKYALLSFYLINVRVKILRAAFYRGNLYIRNFPAIILLSLEHDTLHSFFLHFKFKSIFDKLFDNSNKIARNKRSNCNINSHNMTVRNVECSYSCSIYLNLCKNFGK